MESSLKKQIPGPGQYDAAINTNKMPRYKFGTSVRKSLDESTMLHTPGPGKYLQIIDNLIPSAPKYG